MPRDRSATLLTLVHYGYMYQVLITILVLLLRYLSSTAPTLIECRCVPLSAGATHGAGLIAGAVLPCLGKATPRNHYSPLGCL